jgi:hypothetical protein
MLVLLLKFLLQMQPNMENIKWKTTAVSPHAEEAAISYF